MLKSNKNINILLMLAALISLAALACHPYFNAFYNAEEAFSMGQREHRKVMVQAPDSIVVAPPEGAVAMYDRAIEKSNKMLELFPKPNRYHDRAHFMLGRTAFYKTQFELTLSRIEDLQMQFPESQLIPQSQLYAAKAYIMLDRLNIAEEILLELLKTNPELNRRNEITMLLIEIAIRRGGRSQALGLLEGIGMSSLPMGERIELILRMAEIHYELRNYENALALLHAAPRSRRHMQRLFRVDRAIYFNYDAMDSLETSLAHLENMQRRRAYEARRYEIMYYRALTLYRLERPMEAINLLESIRRSCIATGRADTSSLCAQAVFELARIYQELGDLAKADALYEEASKMRGLPGDMRAHARLMALRRLRELQTPDSLGNISIESRYMIGELYLFDFEHPDSAFANFMDAASRAEHADSLRPRALLASGIIARHSLADTLTSDSLFNVIIAEYFETEYARRAQIEMDVEVTSITTRELARTAFRNAESLLETEPTDAVRAFYNVFMEFLEEADIAARSLHAAAWHTDNTLHRNRAALVLYEELCEVFPDTPYCELSAMPRITVVRDSMAVRGVRRGGDEGGDVEDVEEIEEIEEIEEVEGVEVE